MENSSDRTDRTGGKSHKIKIAELYFVNNDTAVEQPPARTIKGDGGPVKSLNGEETAQALENSQGKGGLNPLSPSKK